MKLFNLHILKQKTLDERLAKAHTQAVIMPNKMISALLRQMAGRNKTLMEAYRGAQMALREKVQNA